jgi:hypothetical protein
MMEIIGELVGGILLVLLLGGMIYAFYWILKYMLEGVKKSDD